MTTTQPEPPQGHWKQCYDGSKLFFHDDGAASFESLTPEIVAHHLATTNRWAGASRVPFSVAQHSLNVAMIARSLIGDVTPAMLARVMLYALLHDAHEGFLGGDTPTPVKWWREARGVQNITKDEESAIDAAIRAAFGLPEPDMQTRAVVKTADELALTSEGRALLLGGCRDDWDAAFKRDERIDIGEAMSWDLARMMYADALNGALAMWAALNPPAIIKPPGPGLVMPGQA